MVAFFAAFWIAPLQAMAAIIPICDGDAISAVGPVFAAVHPAETNIPEDCRALPINAGNSDEHDPQVAAMCDTSAATVVAPNRVHPMTDARIDAAPSCSGIQHGPFVNASHDGPQLDGLSWVHVDPTVLSEAWVMHSRPFVELPPMLMDLGSPHTGFDREIYHPPRS